jgi:hypothetical protein
MTLTLCAAFSTLPVLTGCQSMISRPNSDSVACSAYHANRPTVSDADTVQTMMGVLNLDYAMEAACGLTPSSPAGR